MRGRFLFGGKPVRTSSKTLRTVLCIAFVLSVVACGGPDLTEYEHLKTPQISQKAPQQMLVTERVGDPDETVGDAFGALYGAYYSLDGAKVEEPWPRSRWDLGSADELPKAQWRGVFAVPVSQSLTELPEEYTQADPPIRLETWDYGTVAELLYVGPYEDEMQVGIDKLLAYIEEQGYRTTGLHEEEYLKGPGMIFAGDPNEYITILRYEVAK